MATPPIDRPLAGSRQAVDLGAPEDAGAAARARTDAAFAEASRALPYEEMSEEMQQDWIVASYALQNASDEAGLPSESEREYLLEHARDSLADLRRRAGESTAIVDAAEAAGVPLDRLLGTAVASADQAIAALPSSDDAPPRDPVASAAHSGQTWLERGEKFLSRDAWLPGMAQHFDEAARALTAAQDVSRQPSERAADLNTALVELGGLAQASAGIDGAYLQSPGYDFMEGVRMATVAAAHARDLCGRDPA